MGGAGPHILSIQLAEAAGALRAQHGPAEQAQGRVLPVIVGGLGAPEDGVQRRQAEHLGQTLQHNVVTERPVHFQLTENGMLD